MRVGLASGHDCAIDDEDVAGRLIVIVEELRTNVRTAGPGDEKTGSGRCHRRFALISDVV